MDRGFGNAVHVEQGGAVVPRLPVPRLEGDGVKSLAAENHVPQRMELPAVCLCGDQLSKGARSLVKHGYFLPANDPVKFLRRAGCFFGHYNQPTAIEQCSPYLPNGKVKRIGMEQAPHIVSAKVEPGFGGGK